MNKTIGFQLVVYSLTLAGFSYLIYYLSPVFARPKLTTGLTGGVLCLFWGLRAIGGASGKAPPILTLILVNFALLSQVIMACAGSSFSTAGRLTVPVLVTLIFLASLAMLMRIAYAGVLFDKPTADPMGNRETKSPTPVKLHQNPR